ncbi:M4 family metallopeptidase [Paucibacter sp. APW11]|uniref:M4 family metallopeptidase n=1 Tax=Roseateles aquae TaxID=3077235 RepID=A0ABU3PGE2_9BURK|nr:M4 family metallopeptidase [Paucibacter sp. APW11]MDT9001669.1 M4 family metallopeptidase [Paucibacter sp. APW11]
MTRTHLKLSTLAIAMGLSLAAQAQSGAALAGQSDALTRLSVATGRAPQVSYHGATGAARFVRIDAGSGRQLGAALGSRAGNDDEKLRGAAQFFNSYGALFGISNAAAELSAGLLARDKQGGAHITHKQLYRGVPVFGAELKSHFDSAGKLTAVNGTFVPGIELDTQPSRSAAEAAAAAKKFVTAGMSSAAAARVGTKPAALLIYREGLAQGVPGSNRLVWQVEVGNGVDVREFIFVDANTGKVVDRIAGIHEGKNRRAFDGANVNQPGPNYPGTPFWVEGQPFPTGTTEADNMIAASAEIYDLFKTAFGRDSFDGKGATMDSIFNRGNGCPNASWNGVYISFCPGTTTDDVTAHEWGHAYTEYTHGLIYQWQPGALNEAYSDIWGETVDRINGRGGDTPDAARSVGACTVSTNSTQVNILAPAAIAGTKTAGTAAFGPQTFSLSNVGVVVVDDGSTAGGSTLTDGCTTPFVNAGAVAGKIAFVDRGVCSFAIKVKNAQLNGAVGVIVGNNTAGVINMGGADPTITVPALSITQADGTALKAQSGVVASLQRGPGSDNSVRWLVGEDSSAFGGAIRDMYNPTCYGHPGKVTDTQYACGPISSDNGGVHSNSGVANHGYALLVDGGNYNGQSITGIGLTKAAHIYFRAQTVYQGPASGFPEHADAIEQSCADLTGVNLAHLKTGLPSGEVISSFDCQQVAKVTAAVELRTPPSQCGFQTLLQQTPPPLCPVGNPSVIAADNFDGGKRGGLKWTLSNAGVASSFTPRNFGVVTKLPSGRAGYAIYAADINAGACGGPGSEAGLQRLESPEITIPAGASTLRATFDHWVSTEAGWDGGNLKISVNGGAWQLINAGDFIYNPYNATLNTAAQGSDNPLAGQAAFSGSDGGRVSGSWGRSIINLAPYAVPGDKVKIRFEAGNDCAGGALGWYVDDFSVYSCAAQN